MQETSEGCTAPAPLGFIEPHARNLVAPADGQLLYKIMTVENLLQSITERYLHFNRVDSYSDFPGADSHDGEQPPKDRPRNTGTTFASAPEVSIADYYDGSRARTYACCFSLENSHYIWKNYGNGSQRGKVCVVFDFSKLRVTLNEILRRDNCAVIYNGLRCLPIFSIDYGVVEYVKWQEHRESEARLPNPIRYTYLKDREHFQEEKEVRISLSTLGVGKFVLNDGTEMEFPPTLNLEFDFGQAFCLGTIQHIQCGSDRDKTVLCEELRNLKIVPVDCRDLR